MMMSTSARVLTLSALLAAAASVAPAAAADAGGDLWLHVRVDEADGGKVTVNLPLALIEKALPMIPGHHADSMRFHSHHLAADARQLRELWLEVRDQPDMTFVTVEDDGEKTRVWKQAGTFHIEVRGRGGDQRVDVRLPLPVVDALLAGDDYDFQAAVRALVDHGAGDFVEVRDDRDHIRVWVDATAEAGR